MQIYECTGIRYRKRKVPDRMAMSCPERIYDFIKTQPGAIGPIEVMWAVALNGQNRIMSYFKVSEGTHNSASVYPGEIAKRLLLINAASVVIVHNHPSNSLTPSAQDIRITADCKTGLTALGIVLLDHLIITDKSYISLSEQGHI